MKYHLGIVASHVIQYQAPLYRQLAAHPDIDLTVLYCSRQGVERRLDRDMGVSDAWDIDLLSGYRFEFLRNWSPFGIHVPYLNLINPGVFRAIRRGRFDAVIVMFGWGSLTAWLTFAACGRAGVPFFLYGDSSFPPEERSLGEQLRSFVLRRLFRRTAAFLVSGTYNGDYYRHYGAEERRFFLVPWAVDNDRIMRGSALSPAERQTRRARFRIDPQAVVIMFSGKLVARKDPITLLRAFELMSHRARAALLFVGGGVERPQLEQYAREKRLEQVIFAGFINQAELPAMYGMSDIFVLPSTFEPRGSVVNEAMAAGLPVVTSSRVGSNGDIVQNGVNGLVFPVGEARALAERLDQLVSDAQLRRQMGEKSREIISDWDYRRGVEGVLAALRFTSAQTVQSD